MGDCKESITSIVLVHSERVFFGSILCLAVNLLGSDAKNKDYTRIFLDGIVLKKEDIFNTTGYG